MQVVVSLCEGNILGTHLIGDAIAMAAACAQAPWLCGHLCSALQQAVCISWIFLQVRMHDRIP